MGTVVKDSGAMESALKGVVQHYGIPHTETDLKGMRGAGKRAAFAALLERTLGKGKDPAWSRALAEEMYVTFKGMLADGYAKGPTQEIPGAEATMRWLREQGVKVAATSAVDFDLTEPMLASLGWAEGVFDCKVANQEVPLGRPAPYMIFLSMMRTGVVDVRRVMAVGDTPIDLQAGTNAGLGWVVGVLSGAHSLATLGATSHTHILNSVADLPTILGG
jgi:phosphonatase-like hydrolase